MIDIFLVWTLTVDDGLGFSTQITRQPTKSIDNQGKKNVIL